jgi:hypothetical protein
MTDEELAAKKQELIAELDRARVRRILDATAIRVYVAMKGSGRHDWNEKGLVDHAWQCAALFVERMPGFKS